MNRMASHGNNSDAMCSQKRRIPTDQPASVFAVDVNVYFANRYGVYAVNGVTVQKLSTDIDHMVEKWGIAQKMELTRDPSRRQISLKSAMVTATVTCSEGSMVLDAKLSLLAMPFRSKLDEQIDRWISKNFPA